jgi:hypothetical protein
MIVLLESPRAGRACCKTSALKHKADEFIVPDAIRI